MSSLNLCQIVGDGDCGETCAAGAKAILDALDNGLGKDGEVINVLRYLTGECSIITKVFSHGADRACRANR